MQNEQYPMPAMTEQERQELIRFNVAKLRAITPQFMKEKSPGVKKHLQSEINSAKISLAALTAPPVQVLRPIELPIKWRPCSCVDCDIVLDYHDTVSSIRAAGYEVKE